MRLPRRARRSLSTRSRKPARYAGFTLIEVLVALVIVAVGMSALMGALTSSANSVTYMRDKTFAEWVALNQIATLRLQMTQGQVPPVGNTTGDLEFAARSWHWRQDVVKTPVQGIVRVDLKVRPKELKAGDDDSWYVTVSGLVGDSVGAAAGATAVDWDAGGTSSGLPGQTNPGTSLGGSGTPGNSNTGTGTTGSGSTTTTPNTRPQSGSPTQ